MSYDEQPDGDPHGECRIEIERLGKEVAGLKERDAFLLAATRDAQAYASKYGDEVMELRAQVEALRAELGDLPEAQAMLLTQLKELRAQVAALRTDAERYRWLREEGEYDNVNTNPRQGCITFYAPLDSRIDGDWLDRHIDTARKAP